MVEGVCFLEHAFDGELGGGFFGGGLSEGVGKAGVFEEPGDGLGDGLRVFCGDEEPVFFVVDEFGVGEDVGGDDWFGGGHGFHDADAESFPEGGAGDDVGAGDEAGDVVSKAEEGDVGLDLVVGDGGFDLWALGAFAGEEDVEGGVGGECDEEGYGGDEVGEAFLFGEAAGGEDDLGFGGEVVFCEEGGFIVGGLGVGGDLDAVADGDVFVRFTDSHLSGLFADGVGDADGLGGSVDGPGFEGVVDEAFVEGGELGGGEPGLVMGDEGDLAGFADEPSDEAGGGAVGVEDLVAFFLDEGFEFFGGAEVGGGGDFAGDEDVGDEPDLGDVLEAFDGFGVGGESVDFVALVDEEAAPFDVEVAGAAEFGVSDDLDGFHVGRLIFMVG